MLIKNAKFQIVEISALNTPNNLDYLKDQHLDVDTTSRNLIKVAYQKDGDNNAFNLEAEISEHPDSLFVKCFAIKADEMNDNADYFSEEELKKSYGTFVGVPVFTNHNNTDAEQARGKVIHAWWDQEKHGISVIMRIDTVAYPQLARGIKEKYIASSSMGCFLPDSLIKMANGTTRRIDSVNSDDFVITHKGNIKKILNVQIRHKNEDLLRIKTTGLCNPLEMTKNHKVLRLKQQTKCSCGCNEDLPVYKEGSRRGSNYKNKYRNRYISGHIQNVYNTNPKAKTNNIALLEKAQKPRTYTEQDFEWVEAGLLTKNDVLVFPCNYEKSIIHQPSINEAKLIGYFLAEGSFKKYKNIKKVTQFSFNLNEKETFAQEVKTLLENCFNPEKEVKIYERKKQNICLVSITDDQITNWFFKYCGEGSKTKKLHNEFIYWDENIQKTIIGKFINGDGCFTTRNYFNKNKLSKYSSISINTSSSDLIEQFSTSLSRLGIWHTLNKVKANTRTTVIKNKRLTFNSDVHYVIQINQNYCEKLINFTNKNKKLFNINKTYIKNDDILVCGNYICRKIKNISKFSYTGPVYNLQVQGDNSYIVNNTAVKNCQVKYSLCSVCHNYAETPDSYCFAENTPILMDDFSIKPISEVKEGDSVIDSSGKPTKVLKTFKHLLDNKKALVLKSRAIAGNLICSFNHPFLVQTREEYRFCPAEFLTDKNTLFTPIPSVTQDNIFFEKFGFNHLSEKEKLDLCRFLGFYAAEGSRVLRDGKIRALDINIHQYEEYIKNDIIDICNRLFNKSPYIYTKKNTLALNLRLWSSELAPILYSMCPGKIHEEKSKKFDSTVFSLENKYIIQILRGFNDGDGHCDRNHSIVINSSCPALISQIFYLFLKIKASPSLNTYISCGGPKFRYKKALMHRLHVGNSQLKLLQDVGVKFSKAAKKQTEYSKLTNVFTDDNLYAKHALFSIKEIPFDKPVYNLETESHTYIANNTVVHNCDHVKERKTRTVDINNQKCNYHKHGTEEKCPICGSAKDDIKKYAYKGKVFEHNYGIKFIENSLVVTPACSSCGITEVIDTGKFFDKVSKIADQLPKLLKAASQKSLCDDKKCYKIAGQAELDKLNKAIQEIVDVSQSMLKQTNQIDLEFLSDLVTVLADLQEVVDELTQQGYGRLQSVNSANSPTGQSQTPIVPSLDAITNNAQPVAQNTQPPAGAASSITAPITPVAKVIQIKKKIGTEPYIKVASIQKQLIKLIKNKNLVIKSKLGN